jgi:hypothetical protein
MAALAASRQTAVTAAKIQRKRTIRTIGCRFVIRIEKIGVSIRKNAAAMLVGMISFFMAAAPFGVHFTYIQQFIGYIQQLR